MQGRIFAWRHYDCTGQFRLNLDDVKIMDGKTIDVEFTTMAFGEVFTSTDSIRTVAVDGYFLTEGITATAPESSPFTVSADNTTFGQTATLSQNGGTLYVKYAPTAVGENTGEIILSSEGADDVTIALTGLAYDCDPITEFPWTENFDGDAFPNCWTVVDVNRDDCTWSLNSSMHCLQYKYNSSNVANDYAFTRAMQLSTGIYSVKFKVACGLTTYHEKLAVYLGTGSTVAEITDTLCQPFEITNSYEGGFLTKSVDVRITDEGTYYFVFKACSDADAYYLYLDDVEIKHFEAATIEPSPAELTFDQLVTNDSTVKRLEVFGHGLTAEVTATIPEDVPFTISADNTTFGQTATLPQDGGTLYVKYLPTTEDAHTGTITLSSEGASDVTVAVSGSAIDCGTPRTLPFEQGFEGDTLPACWRLLDKNNDGDNFERIAGETYAHSGNGCIISASAEASFYGTLPINPDNWLITPAIAISADLPYVELSFYAAGLGTNFSEHFGVYVTTSATPDNDSAYHLLREYTTTGDYRKYMICLNEYKDDTIYIAFRHFNTPTAQNILRIDDIEIKQINGTSFESAVSALDFGTQEVGYSRTLQAEIIGRNLNVDITATLPDNSNFSVSADGSTFASTAQIPQQGGMLYVKYTPTADGVANDTIILSVSGLENDTITLTGTAFSCDVISEFPWVENFETDITQNRCWRNVDNDGDGNKWEFRNNNEGPVTPYGSGCMVSHSFDNYVGALTPDNYLITPSIAIPDASADEGAMTLGFYVAAQDPNWPQEHYKVLVSRTGFESFTEGVDTLLSETLQHPEWSLRQVNLMSYAGDTIKIAFVHCQCTDRFAFKLDSVQVFYNTAVDASVTAVEAPSHGDYATCRLTAEEAVTAVITNRGGLPLQNLPIWYTVNGGERVVETVTNEIAAAESVTFTFEQKADLSELGVYNIVVSVDTDDADVTNNSKALNIVSGDGNIHIHAYTDSTSDQSWAVLNKISNDTIAQLARGWQWGIEVNDHVCVFNDSCYDVTVREDSEDQPQPPAYTYVEIKYNGETVAGTMETGHFNGLVSAFNLGEGCDYTVTCTQPANGRITASTATVAAAESITAAIGESVTITVEPDDGYVLNTLTYNDGDSNHDITASKRFNMPAADVTVEAELTQATDIVDDELAAISIFPNPASDNLVIANAEGRNILIVNMLGETVVSVNSVSTNQQIDVSGLANGAYLVKIDGAVWKIDIIR